MKMNAEKRVLFGISFDGVPMSGLTVEFMKVAHIFHQKGYQVYFDLGYDIKADKNNYHKDLPSWDAHWMTLKRICDLRDLSDYNRAFVEEVLETIVRHEDNGSKGRHMRDRVDRVAAIISDRILKVWRELEVSFVIVENGTLPENIIFTRALYEAIRIYGKERNLGKFVMWRDHDLMWWSEPGKYGSFPYEGTPKPQPLPYIQHVVIQGLARDRLSRWAPGLHVEVLTNCFSFERAGINDNNRYFRRDFSIPEKAVLIARCTRIIPQKRIDRDIHLLSQLTAMAKIGGVNREFCLFIAGDINEDRAEFEKLCRLASQLGVASQVIFGKELGPFEERFPSRRSRGRYSVKDLLAHCQINSFLTSYDYEGFGNPIGESIASGIPYMSTSYELYGSIYGHIGFKAPLLPICKKRDDFADEDFVGKLFSFLMDDKSLRETVDYNYSLGEQYFSLDQLEQRIVNIFKLSGFGDYEGCNRQERTYP
ncbi:MAG: glycosyltransferase [Deltaproteobacteria bacterium]|nr:glycosyltransferase [Deltaproteobacteria bacterium]